MNCNYTDQLYTSCFQTIWEKHTTSIPELAFTKESYDFISRHAAMEKLFLMLLRDSGKAPELKYLQL